MSRRIPIKAVGQKLVEIVLANAAIFSSELQRVQIGSRYAFARTAAQLAGCLPAVVATIADVTLSNSDSVQQYLDQEIPWDLNLLVAIPETGDADLAFLADQEKLAQLFSDDPNYTLSGETTVEIESITPIGIFQHTDFQELEEPLPIAWARVRIMVSLSSWQE